MILSSRGNCATTRTIKQTILFIALFFLILEHYIRYENNNGFEFYSHDWYASLICVILMYIF